MIHVHIVLYSIGDGTSSAFKDVYVALNSHTNGIFHHPRLS
jgi:hypothetical protein